MRSGLLQKAKNVTGSYGQRPGETRSEDWCEKVTQATPIQQILNELPDYPYELFYTEGEEDTICCLVDGCEEVFETYEEYLEHFMYNAVHLNFVKRNLMLFKPREGLGEELVWDPIEKLEIEDNIKNDKNYAALKYNRDATKNLEDKLKFAVKHKRNIIAIVIGVPGAGKTYATIALAYKTAGMFAASLGKQTKVDLRFTQAEFLQLVKETVDCEGDNLIQDEDPTGFGSGQKTNEGAFENLGKTVRKKQLNIWVVSPIKPELKNIGFIIEFFAYYPKERITKGVLYTRTGLALGYIYVEILPEEDYVIYEEMKDEFLDNMIASGGFGIENFPEEKIMEDFEALLKYVRTKEGTMSKTRVKSCASVKVRGNTDYQNFIAADVWEHINKHGMGPTDGSSPKKVTGTVGLGERKFDYESLESIKDPEIGDLIYKHSRPTTEHQRLGKEWWKYYFCVEDAKGQQAADFINEELNVDYNKMAYYNTFFPKFTGDEECFGKAVERAIHERYYPTYIIDGGTGKPDLISKDTPPKYIEVKARKDKTTRDILGYFTNKDKDKDRSYIWELLAQGADVCLIELVYGPKCDFTINLYRLYMNVHERRDESN